MEGDIAGDPCSQLRWTRQTTASVALALLQSYGIRISDRTISRILRSLGFSLRVNHKQLSRTQHPDRNKQFSMISAFREQALNAYHPIISVDTKKKELIGCFHNSGTHWRRMPKLVNDHDFPSLAKCTAIPYGIYDLHANTGSFYVGTSCDTSQFAVDCIACWWREIGQQQYPNTDTLYILADSGGSNSCRTWAWKYFLQYTLANAFGLTASSPFCSGLI